MISRISSSQGGKANAKTDISHCILTVICDISLL